MEIKRRAIEIALRSLRHIHAMKDLNNLSKGVIGEICGDSYNLLLRNVTAGLCHHCHVSKARNAGSIGYTFKNHLFISYEKALLDLREAILPVGIN